MLVDFDTASMASYRQFLKLKRLPVYSWHGATAVIPDEYSAAMSGVTEAPETEREYKPSKYLFDYQRDVAAMAIRKQKFAVFAECGLGKTAILLEFARHALASVAATDGILIVSPLMVIPQTISEANRFYPKLKIKQIAAADLQAWLDKPDKNTIGITNYEAIREGLTQGRLAGLVLDESSMLKSHYGAWGLRLIDLGRGLKWKLCLTGTPAPNDRIEYANHSIFLDHKKTTNEFLARYFVNRGETQNRWEIKPHALRPFYRDLSHWCIFLSNPATYGWKDNCETIPPIKVHIDHIDLTTEQRSASQKLTGTMFVNNMGGIGERGKLSQLAKGKGGVATNKPEFIRNMVDSWPDESTIIWCHYNDEQESMERVFPDAVSISGDTPIKERLDGIAWFKGEICTCELKKRNANTAGHTIKKTKANGQKELLSSEPQETLQEMKSMQQMPNCEAEPGKRSRSGKRQTQGSGLTSECENMESQHPTMTASSLPNMDCVQSANSRNLAEIDRKADSMSTTATQPEESEGCCAATAITASANLKTRRSVLSRPLCTCELENTRGRILISKPRVLGFGLNLQIATRQVFSGLQDSYEEFHQAVKRSNRVGSTRPLNVHIPVTELEEPMIANVLRKADRVQKDTEEQEAIFKSERLM